MKKTELALLYMPYAGATVEGSQRLILVRGMDLGIKALPNTSQSAPPATV